MDIMANARFKATKTAHDFKRLRALLLLVALLLIGGAGAHGVSPVTASSAATGTPTGVIAKAHTKNAAAPASVRGNYALGFDGCDSYMTVAYSPTVTPVIGTVAAWIKVSPVITGQVVVVRQPNGRPQLLIVNHEARIQVNTTEGSFDYVTGTSAVDDGQWHFLAGTFSPVGLALYVDESWKPPHLSIDRRSS